MQVVFNKPVILREIEPYFVVVHKLSLNEYMA